MLIALNEALIVSFFTTDFRITLTANNEKIKQPTLLDWLIASKESVNGKVKVISVASTNLI